MAGSGRDVRFSYTGEMKPYGRPIEVVIDGGFENLSLSELEALAGPLGLSRAEGRFAAQGKHRLTLSADAGQEITNQGTLSASGIDVALPGLNALRLDQAHLRLDGSATVAPDGRVEFSNRAPWTIAGLVVAWSEAGAVKVAEATLDLDIGWKPGRGRRHRRQGPRFGAASRAHRRLVRHRRGPPRRRHVARRHRGERGARRSHEDRGADGAAGRRRRCSLGRQLPAVLPRDRR